jgi:hypothetical protein
MKQMLAEILFGFIVGLGFSLYVGVAAVTVFARLKQNPKIRFPRLLVMAVTAISGLLTSAAAITFVFAKETGVVGFFMSIPSLVAFSVTFVMVLALGYVYFFLVSSGKTKAPKETTWWIDGPMPKP